MVADALLRKNTTLLTRIETHILGLDALPNLYPSDSFFGTIYEQCLTFRRVDDFYLHEGFLLKLTNYGYPSPLFVCCYCKKHMVEDSWVILDARRLMPCFQRTTFGQGCTAMSRGTYNDALHAYKLSPNLIHLVYTCLYLFHTHHGRTLA
jgi:hypothetical protein